MRSPGVAGGAGFTAAAQAAGRRSGDVAKLVGRFNALGLAALVDRPRAGRAPTYQAAARARILAEARRAPDPAQDGTATWSLSTLRRALTATTNAVLHPWIKAQLGAILDALPPAPPVTDEAANLLLWQRWQRGLRGPLGLGEKMPALRMLLVLNNLAGHLSVGLVCWMFEHGVMPLYTPIGGSWLNMAD